MIFSNFISSTAAANAARDNELHAGQEQFGLFGGATERLRRLVGIKPAPVELVEEEEEEDYDEEEQSNSKLECQNGKSNKSNSGSKSALSESLAWQLKQKYTLSEVQAHSSLDDCWMVIFDKVYNITEFVDEHPGGEFILLEYAGRDATHPFLSSRHGSLAYKMLDKYWIGILVDEELYYSNNSSYCSVYSSLSWRSVPTLEATSQRADEDDDDDDDEAEQTAAESESLGGAESPLITTTTTTTTTTTSSSAGHTDDEHQEPTLVGQLEQASQQLALFKLAEQGQERDLARVSCANAATTQTQQQARTRSPQRQRTLTTNSDHFELEGDDENDVDENEEDADSDFGDDRGVCNTCLAAAALPDWRHSAKLQFR